MSLGGKRGWPALAPVLMLLLGWAAAACLVDRWRTSSLAVRQPVRRMEPWRTWLRKSIVLALVASLGIGYGGWRVSLVPTQVDRWLGQPAQFDARVSSLKAVTGGEVLDLQIDRMVADGQTHRCQVSAEWPLWGTADDGSFHAGDTVTLSGVLVYPQAQTSKGMPLQRELAKAGIDYTFQGKCLTDQPVSSSLLSRMRAEVDRAVAAVPAGTTDEKTLLESVVFGGENVSGAEQQTFLAAGLLHVLAASGANIMLIESALARIAGPLWRRLHLPAVGWTLSLIAFAWGFAALAGFGASIVRAAIMSSYRHLGRAFSRPVAMLDGLSMSAFVMSIWQPSEMSTPSALLSFVATAALAFGMHASRHPRRRANTRPIMAVCRSLWSHLQSTLISSLVIEFALAPLTLVLFQQVTPYAFLTNLLVEPVLMFLLPLSAGYMLVSLAALGWPALMPVAIGFAQLCDQLLTVVLSVANFMAARPKALVTTAPVPHADWFVLGFYGCGLCLSILWQTSVRRGGNSPPKL
ncbi:ComEC/Rec2 family competence protein [Alicyclobacillus cycloheptanicus]|uniref:ComEC/Rec2-related protein n=1 Tax=Alicyclobacillus cycloheptanicus TaxID=1457 RepID=A0ABT9XJN5_9BACL|nr:ComEC/Rec2 family competence protein [Alicyclobacillus cycloheptanicus]MDQ0190498.1 ComEC/Rec2-related protein [Alicyclobacillus cycloheptanicus]WDM00740.1 ComEC/Rec2 family competence protein [Alicyclobacillus cycloheptanicus]